MRPETEMNWEELPAFQPAVCDLAGQAGLTLDDQDDPLVVIGRDLMAAILRHASPTADEVMGLLCGTALSDETSGRMATVVKRVWPMTATQASRTSVLAGVESWRRAWKGLEPGEQIVGWYHSHPGHGVFFSARDRQTQRECFPQPWQVGLVVDPSDGAFGAFGTFAGGDCRSLRVLVGADSAPPSACEL